MRELSLKNMIKTYYNSQCSGKVWDTFVHMRNLGYISDNTWGRFSLKCSAWFYDYENMVVYDLMADGTMEIVNLEDEI